MGGQSQPFERARSQPGSCRLVVLVHVRLFLSPTGCKNVITSDSPLAYLNTMCWKPAPTSITALLTCTLSEVWPLDGTNRYLTIQVTTPLAVHAAEVDNEGIETDVLRNASNVGFAIDSPSNDNLVCRPAALRTTSSTRGRNPCNCSKVGREHPLDKQSIVFVPPYSDCALRKTASDARAYRAPRAPRCQSDNRPFRQWRTRSFPPDVPRMETQVLMLRRLHVQTEDENCRHLLVQPQFMWKHGLTSSVKVAAAASACCCPSPRCCRCYSACVAGLPSWSNWAVAID